MVSEFGANGGFGRGLAVTEVPATDHPRAEQPELERERERKKGEQKGYERKRNTDARRTGQNPHSHLLRAPQRPARFPAGDAAALSAPCFLRTCSGWSAPAGFWAPRRRPRRGRQRAAS